MVREGRGVVRLYEVGFIEDPLVPGVLEGSCAVVERWRGVVREGGAWSEKEGVWLDYMRSDL